MAAKPEENGAINKGSENRATEPEVVILDSDGGSEMCKLLIMAAKPEENGAINKGSETESEVVMLDSDGSSESRVEGGCEGGCIARTGGACFGSSCFSCALRPIPPFLLKIYDMLENNETNSIVSWSSTGTSFVITNPHWFAANVLPIYFRHRNFQSFVTQLNSYGFKKISWDQWEYRNDNFRKGEKHLLRNIKRRNQIPPSAKTEPSVTTSNTTNTEKELEIMMKEHDLLKAEIMKITEKQANLEQNLASLRNQAIINRKDQKRIMFAVQRIITKQRDRNRILTAEEKNLKGKRKIEEKWPVICADFGDIAMGNTVEMICEHLSGQGKMVADEEDQIGKNDQLNPLISLEDLIGESSDWMKYMRDLQEKASQSKS